MSNYYEETPFDDILQDIVRKRSIQAIMALEGMLYKIQRSPNDKDLLKYIFAIALLKLLNHPTGEYIHPALDLSDTTYHKNPKKYQQEAVQVFELNNFMFYVSNQIIIDKCKDNTSLTLFNIGRLNHDQIKHLFTLIQEQKTAIKHIIFLDFLSLSLEEIQENQALFQQYAPNIKVEYFSNQKKITQLNKQEWDVLHTIYGEQIVIYIPYQADYPLDAQFVSTYTDVSILRELKEFKPLLFLLFALDSNLEEVNFIRRFHITWNYVPHLFDYIDNLDTQAFSKKILKLRFQAMIERIIANNSYKIGKFSHFKAPSYWVERLSLAGFKIPNKSLIPIPELPPNKLLNLKFYDGYLGINFKNKSFIGIVAVTL